MKNIKLIPDPTEGGDPFAVDASEVDISRHIIPAGYYSMLIGAAEKRPNSKLTGENLVLSWRTIVPCQSVKGETVNSGFSVIENISLTPTEKYDVDAIRKRIARVIRAVGASGQVRTFIDDPMLLVGKTANRVKVKVRPETPEFAARNEIDGYEIPA